MDSLVHATIRVTGPREQRESFQARLYVIAATEPIDGEVEERHGEGELLYDLKVRGGIPFPPFVAASRESPDLEIDAEWFNANAGLRGRARIHRGVLQEQQITRREAADSGVYVEIEPAGRLALALACRENGPGSFAGYAASSSRDAMFLLTRSPGEAAGELLATSGGNPEWSEHWLLDFEADICEHGVVDPPAPIPEDLRAKLEESARALLRDWVWLASAPVEDIIIEQRRYEEKGREVRPINLKSVRLKELEQQETSGRRVVDTLPPDLEWLKEVMRECWAETVNTD
jgi:hypothetical protein